MAVFFRTVSQRDQSVSHAEPFLAFPKYLEGALPRFHKTLDRQVVGTEGIALVAKLFILLDNDYAFLDLGIR